MDKEKEEKERKQRITSLISKKINNYKSNKNYLKEFYERWMKNTLTKEEIEKINEKLKKKVIKISINKESDTKKLNKIEDEQVYIPINNDLFEENKIDISIRQTPSMPSINTFILEELKPIKIEKNKPNEIKLPDCIADKKVKISYIPQIYKEFKFNNNLTETPSILLIPQKPIIDKEKLNKVEINNLLVNYKSESVILKKEEKEVIIPSLSDKKLGKLISPEPITCALYHVLRIQVH